MQEIVAGCRQLLSFLLPKQKKIKWQFNQAKDTLKKSNEQMEDGGK